MPSRLLIALIVLFWLGSMTWLAVREVLPRYNVGEPPAMTIDLTDEVNTGGGNANWIEWSVAYQGQSIGSCFSSVRRLPDGNFEFKTHYKFKDFKLLSIEPLPPVELKKLQFNYVVNQEGHLRRMYTLVVINNDLELSILGDVEDGFLLSTLIARMGEKDLYNAKLSAINVSSVGNILNTMHLQNRVRGLYVGRSWRVPMLDSSAAIELGLQKLLESFAPIDLGLKKRTTSMQARVVADTISWNGDLDVECYRIDHWEPGEEVSAKTWVRRRDDLLLKQEAVYAGRRLVAERVPVK